MLFSARNTEELLFKSKFDTIANEHPDMFSVEYNLTREGNSGNRVTKERISSTLKEKFQSQEKVFFYLCGPPQMIKDLTQDLISLGIPKCNIKYELWWWDLKILASHEKKSQSAAISTIEYIYFE